MVFTDLRSENEQSKLALVSRPNMVSTSGLLEEVEILVLAVGWVRAFAENRVDSPFFECKRESAVAVNIYIYIYTHTHILCKLYFF
ncbi:hypothetical protein COP2_039795 [Malus domestica]